MDSLKHSYGFYGVLPVNIERTYTVVL